jgi:hypothetical protein
MWNPNAYNLILEVEPGRKSDLLAILAQIADELYDNPVFRFPALSRVHFGRFVVLDEVVKDGKLKYPAYLVLSTNYDGTLQEHLEELVSHSPEGLDQILRCCRHYPSGTLTQQQRIDFLTQHAQYRAYFYRGTWGRSVKQIHREEACRIAAEQHLDELGQTERDSSAIRQEIVRTIQNNPEYVAASPVALPQLGWKNILPLALFVVATLILLLPFLIVLRIHEALDKQIEKKASPKAKTQKLVAQEDFLDQNQLTHLVEVKRGWFRLFTLKFVLHGVDWLAKYVYNQGNLGGIPSIHYARWILIDGGKRLLFFSNFDGSWESYLGDFVDRGAPGLTGVWSNTKGFPFTRFLLFRGAKDEQRFKAWAREHQIPTQVWYSAYPHLSIRNIHNNAAIHDGVSRDLSATELERWLARF